MRFASRVEACGVCRTDLHLVDGELPDPKLPVVPGHQVVGVVESAGEGAGRFEPGDRVGIPWLGWAAASAATAARAARTSASGRSSRATCATAATPSWPWPTSASACPSRRSTPTIEAAPLLCAGLIGYRALRMTGDAERLGPVRLRGLRPPGLPGGGAPGQARVRASPGRVTTRARRWRARWAPSWAGATGEEPEELDAAIIFAPAGELVPEALARAGAGRRSSSARAST